MSTRQYITPFGYVANETANQEQQYITPFGSVQDVNQPSTGANPKGPLGMPLHGPFAGPVAA